MDSRNVIGLPFLVKNFFRSNTFNVNKFRRPAPSVFYPASKTLADVNNIIAINNLGRNGSFVPISYWIPSGTNIAVE